MLTRGSKVFFGLALAGLFGGILYGVITNGFNEGGVWVVLTGKGAVDAILGPLTLGYKGGVGDQLGYTLFMSFAVCAAGMGFASLAFRDADPEALAELDGTGSVPQVSEPNDLSQWPLITAFSVALLAIGLASNEALVYIALGAIAICAVEWTVKAWSERASGDPAVNQTVRNRLMHPIEIPVAGLILIAIVVFGFSRILLALDKWGAIAVATVIMLVIFGVAVAIGTRPQIRRGLVVGALIVGGIVVLALAIGGVLAGEHEVEPHHEGEHAAAVTVPVLGEAVAS